MVTAAPIAFSVSVERIRLRVIAATTDYSVIGATTSCREDSDLIVAMAIRERIVLRVRAHSGALKTCWRERVMHRLMVIKKEE